MKIVVYFVDLEISEQQMAVYDLILVRSNHRSVLEYDACDETLCFGAKVSPLI